MKRRTKIVVQIKQEWHRAWKDFCVKKDYLEAVEEAKRQPCPARVIERKTIETERWRRP